MYRVYNNGNGKPQRDRVNFAIPFFSGLRQVVAGSDERNMKIARFVGPVNLSEERTRERSRVAIVELYRGRELRG